LPLPAAAFIFSRFASFAAAAAADSLFHAVAAINGIFAITMMPDFAAGFQVRAGEGFSGCRAFAFLHR